MKVKEIMTDDPAVCTPDTGLPEVARLMVEEDCGAIPVVDDPRNRRPIGMITDRDITCRAVAQGKNPLEETARDCMSKPAVTIKPEDGLEDCPRLMEEHQIRRVPVVDDTGALCGLVTQAGIARLAPESEVARVVRGVSQPKSR